MTAWSIDGRNVKDDSHPAERWGKVHSHCILRCRWPGLPEYLGGSKKKNRRMYALCVARVVLTRVVDVTGAMEERER